MKHDEAMAEYWGEPISVYTDEQAVADGMLHHLYPEKFPWLLVTDGVFRAIEENPHHGPDATLDQKAIPLFLDAAMACGRNTLKARRNLRFPISLEGTVAGDVWIEPNGKGGLTIMFPSER